jgi:predicted PhzF superfamily epimerase YddE/YHI9
MSERVDVDVLRVFTDAHGGFGNELGIVTSGGNSRGREQAIARELGFSETVFVDAVSEGAAEIRIFTPETELGFAGHPSVGCAWWFANAGTPVTTLVEKAGDIAVRRDGEITWIVGRPSWAPEFEWLALSTPAEVDALDPDAFTEGHSYAWAWIDEAAGSIRSRMFAPVMGIREDEATGAATVHLTALLGRGLDVRQGRGSRIVTRRLDGDRVEVGGRTVFDRRLTLD